MQNDWLKLAESIPQGHKVRRDCPECGEGTNTNAAIVNHSHKGYSLYCNACGYKPFRGKGNLTLAQLAEIEALNDEAAGFVERKLPADFTTDMPLEGRLWLYKAGITEERWRECGFGYSERQKRVVMPIYDRTGALIWYQSRALHKQQQPKYLQPSGSKGGSVFKQVYRESDCGRDNKAVILVEDILSAIRIGVLFNVVCILGTKLADEQSESLREYSTVITWLDSDRAGRKGAANIRKTLGLIKQVGNIVTEKDPKFLPNAEITRVVTAELTRLENAQ
jgi:DNA primase/predicted RNA-binding Zn-ribbon protein involved in translation (DUF1610 family)